MSPKEYLQFLITSLVDHADQVQIEETHDDMGTLLTLAVNPDDMGMIIGRGGKTIDALRTILRIYGSKQEQKVYLRLLEEKQ